MSLVHRKRRKSAEALSRFSDLISNPVVAGTITVPAGSFFAVGNSTDTVAVGDVTVTTSTGRSLGSPILVGGHIHQIGWIEAGVKLTISSTATGVATLYVLDDRRKPYKIGTT
jgi:hypothetical protein